ncbi:acyltransferase family protein [Jiulongibacter sediminis]|uniref:Glucan biosynthesis protein n=1 Tax=Jiulongibacter sediminis TaxID=1605367 RepID=A0A0N8H9U4_9BACT|nr:acyltransferase [Jiulongibacter sediminis]KPM48340.1 glucan biosynthesis protein [Jiulongibacter sediminis]TBX24877.1 glucan biosynthesis protein [Jiulongibacter sediminis]
MERRYDIDWLRILAFALLIFYHTGMFFVPWGWHIKNPVIYDWLQAPMLFMNRWRMPLLFIISGMGVAFSLKKREPGNFIWERIKMLLTPLIFGMLVVVPPQIYAERVVDGAFAGSYFQFWPSQLFVNGAYPEGNFSWHHLWFLPYILVFSLVLLPLFLLLKRYPEGSFIKMIHQLVSGPLKIYALTIPLILLEVFVDPFFPVTHDLIHDWFYLLYNAVLFFYGFLFISVYPSFLKALQKGLKGFLFTGIIAYATFLFLRTFEDGWPRHIAEAVVNQISLLSWLLLFFSLSARYLNIKSKAVAYWNRAVYPFYILHQTVIILLAWGVMDADWNLFFKFSFISLACFFICWALYEFIIKRFKLTRLFFGVRPSTHRVPGTSSEPG